MLDAGSAADLSAGQRRCLAQAAPAEPTVHISVLRCFEQLVRRARADPDELLRAAGLSREVFAEEPGNLRIPYAKTVALLNLAAVRLQDPNLGLRLASEQARNGFYGPLAIAMRNSIDFGSAFKMLAECNYTYSDCTDVTIVPDPARGRWLTRIDVTARDRCDDRQFVEHAILTTHMIARLITDDRVKAKEIWIRHFPLGSETAYQDYFEASVKFSQPFHAVIFSAEDKAVQVRGSNSEVFHIATNFIERHYSRPDEPLSHKVRRVLIQHKNIGDSSTGDVAAALGMHPRTLQRRLSEEGTRFHLIKDEICRELALRYLRGTQIPLARVAGMLGYSELSAFSHRCRRWFGHSPGELRRLADVENSH